MTEAQERFLRAIAERVPPASIAELHLFPAIRQGGYETGIAVIAAEPAAARALPAVPAAEPVEEPVAEVVEEPADEPIEEPAATRGDSGADGDESPYADDTVAQGDLGMMDDATPDGEDSTDADAPGAFATGAPPHRLIVLSARYRLTLKGVDRGKWDVEVVAQADAPLVTVDAVVRGVQRRAGDAGDPARLTGEALRALLDEWSCTATTR